MGESGRPAGVLIAFIQEKWEVRGGRRVVVSEAWWRPRGREVGQKGDSLWALHTSRDREGTLSQSSPSHWLRIIAHGLRVPSRSALTALLKRILRQFAGGGIPSHSIYLCTFLLRSHLTIARSLLQMLPAAHHVALQAALHNLSADYPDLS